MLLPSAVQGQEGLEAMYGLLMTFIKRGGHAMHINVFDADMLRAAQKEPEKYQDLQIRVCGWNVLWNNISKAEQFVLRRLLRAPGDRSLRWQFKAPLEGSCQRS